MTEGEERLNDEQFTTDTNEMIPYDHHMEPYFIKGLFSDNSFGEYLIKNFKPQYFGDTGGARLFDGIQTFYDEHNIIPNKREILFHLKIDLSDDAFNDVKEFFRTVLSVQITSTKALKRHAEKFRKQCIFAQAIHTSFFTDQDGVANWENDPDKAFDTFKRYMDMAYSPDDNGKFQMTFPHTGESFKYRDDIKDKKYWLYPLVPRGGHITLLAGSKGCGKSMFCLKLADVITKNDNWYVWKGYDREECAPSAARCLYLDGEMAPSDLKQRVAEMDMNENFIPYQYKDMSNEDTRASLSNADYREFLLKRIVEERFDVVFIDNVVSLFVGIDENNEKEWSPINQWLLDLRMNNVCVFLIHHMGKDSRSGARGTSHRYDNVDDTLYLTSPKKHDKSKGLKFWLKFEHFRSYVPHDEREELLKTRLLSYENNQWDFGSDSEDESQNREDEIHLKALKYVHADQNIRVMELREFLGVGKNYPILNQLQEKLYIRLEGRRKFITPLGNEFINSRESTGNLEGAKLLYLYYYCKKMNSL